MRFKPGHTSATFNGSVTGYDMNTYILGANAGQTLSIAFTASNNSCYYNVDAPTADEALFNGSTDGRGGFTGVLPADGKYQIKAYLMRNAARRQETCKFSFSIEIKD